MIQFLKGKKSYIIGGLTILLGLYYKRPEMIALGFSTMALRAGIANSLESLLEQSITPEND